MCRRRLKEDEVMRRSRRRQARMRRERTKRRRITKGGDECWKREEPKGAEKVR